MQDGRRARLSLPNLPGAPETVGNAVPPPDAPRFSVGKYFGVLMIIKDSTVMLRRLSR